MRFLRNGVLTLCPYLGSRQQETIGQNDQARSITSSIFEPQMCSLTRTREDGMSERGSNGKGREEDLSLSVKQEDL